MKIKHYIQRKPVQVKSYTSKGHKTVYLYETWVQRFWRKTKLYTRLGLWSTAVIGFAMLTGAILVKQNMPVKVLGIENTVVIESKELSPVLIRIAHCESNKKHFENGQVLVRANKNGTIDKGIFQINSVWDKQATKLGLNLMVEEDNIAFAKWLYKNRGTEEWYSSKRCWHR